MKKIKDYFSPKRTFFTHLNYVFPDISSEQLSILFFVNCGEKPVAPIVEMYSDDSHQITDENLQIMSDIFLSIFKSKWDREVSAFNEKYDAIHNYLDELTESSTIVDNGSETLNTTLSETASNSYTNSSTRTDDLTTSLKGLSNKTRTDDLTSAENTSDKNTRTDNTVESITKSGTSNVNSTDSKSLYAFNSEEASPSENKSTSNDSNDTFQSTKNNTGTVMDDNVISKTTSNTGTQEIKDNIDNTTKNTGTQKISKSTNEYINSTKANTGTNSTSNNKEIIRSLTHKGNIGNIATQDLLLKELEVSKKKLVDYILSDAKELFTLSIYY